MRHDRQDENWAKSLAGNDPGEKRRVLRRLYEHHHPVLWALGRARVSDRAFLKDVSRDFWRSLAQGAVRPAPETPSSPLGFLLVEFHRFLGDKRRERGLADAPALTERDMEEL